MLQRQQATDERAGWTLPGLNRLVQIRMPDQRAVTSRVDDLAVGGVVLSAPTDTAGAPLPVAVDDELELCWTSDRGLWGCHATVVAHTRKPLPQWTVTATAAPVLRQRRDAYRLPMETIVLLQVGGRVTEAGLLDLSDTGLRVRVDAGFAVPRGAPLQVTLPLEDGQLVAAAEVARSGRADVRDGILGLRLLGLDLRQGDRIRRHLVNAQLRQRAAIRR